jgi:hypothetical protein
VGHDHHRRPSAIDAVEQLHDPDRSLRVEVSGRLVGQQQRRVVDERSRDRHALLLPAGELVRIAVNLRLQPDEPQDLGDLPADDRSPGAGDLQRVGDVVVHGAVRQQLEVLEDGPDPAAQVRDAPLRQAVDVVAGDKHLAARRLDLADQRPDQGRLAAPRRADDERELAALDAERDPLKRHLAAGIDDGGIAQLDDRRALLGRLDLAAVERFGAALGGASAPFTCRE